MFGGIHGAEQVINCHGGGESVILEANGDLGIWRARIYNARYKSLRVDGARIIAGQWQHLALVYDDSQLDDPTQQAILYVDGELFTGDATGYNGAGVGQTNGNQMVWSNGLESGVFTTKLPTPTFDYY